jgi:hypothetical protein
MKYHHNLVINIKSIKIKERIMNTEIFLNMDKKLTSYKYISVG